MPLSRSGNIGQGLYLQCFGKSNVRVLRRFISPRLRHAKQFPQTAGLLARLSNPAEPWLRSCPSNILKLLAPVDGDVNIPLVQRTYPDPNLTVIWTNLSQAPEVLWSQIQTERSPPCFRLVERVIPEHRRISLCRQLLDCALR